MTGINFSFINTYTECKWYSPTKRLQLAGWIQNHDPMICCLHKQLTSQKYTQAESEGLGKDTPSKWKPKAGRHSVAILISDKTDLKSKLQNEMKDILF